jgi:hypothetical protein
MKKFLKYLSAGLLIVLIISILAVVTPRIWSALNPKKPPVGYHFMTPAYVALWIGLEKLVNIAPQVPRDIEETDSLSLTGSGHKIKAIVDIYGCGKKGQ